jgi:hypothetical protein
MIGATDLCHTSPAPYFKTLAFNNHCNSGTQRYFGMGDQYLLWVSYILLGYLLERVHNHPLLILTHADLLITCDENTLLSCSRFSVGVERKIPKP